MSSTIQRLTPVQVPWMVSPSTSYLRLLAAESSSDKLTQVRFIAHFGLERSEASTEIQGPPVTFFPPYDSNIKLGPKSGPYQLVRVTFSRGLWVRMLPSFSNSETVDPGLYDFSSIPSQLAPGQDIKSWLAGFQHTWLENNCCPDPRMYEVQNSLWLRDVSKDAMLKHYLVLGNDAYTEVLAEKWHWESEGAIR